MPRSRSRSPKRTKSISPKKMNNNTRRGSRSRKKTVSFVNEQKKIANAAEAKKIERNVAAFYKKYANVGITKNEVIKRHTRSNLIKNLHTQTQSQRREALNNMIRSLEKFKFSNSPKSSPKTRKSPKNPFMVNRRKSFSMNNLWKEIQEMNK